MSRTVHSNKIHGRSDYKPFKVTCRICLEIGKEKSGRNESGTGREEYNLVKLKGKIIGGSKDEGFYTQEEIDSLLRERDNNTQIEQYLGYLEEIKTYLTTLGKSVDIIAAKDYVKNLGSLLEKIVGDKK